MKHSDMSKLAQEIRELFLLSHPPVNTPIVSDDNAQDWERVASFVRSKVEKAIRLTVAEQFSAYPEVAAAVIEDITKEVMPKVLPQSEANPQPQPKKEPAMNETEKKIEAWLSANHKLLHVRPDCEQNELWPVVRENISRWHDDEMMKLVEKISNAVDNVMDSDDWNRNSIQYAISSTLPKPAEPLSPFGCKCWRLKDGLWTHWEGSDLWGHFGYSIGDHYAFCPFCGKARVEKK